LRVFAPGCALIITRPALAGRLLQHLVAESAVSGMHLTCCRHEPRLPSGTVVVNTCPGCDRRYRELYAGITTISLWEVLAESERFPFPDYGGIEMTIQDACPTRGTDRVHDAVRRLLRRMGIAVVEPAFTRRHSICCGDRYFGVVEHEEVARRMQERAAQMPRPDVAVYCVSCVKSMHLGGRRPRHLVDLLFGEPTNPGTCDPSAWHGELDAFIAAH
jgi:Fe-S oxidoreductase